MLRPNILFLLSDEHSFRYMGHVPEAEGGEPGVATPTFDRLASTGTTFTDAYCQMPLCTPSRISLLCGKQAGRCGAWGNESVLDPALDTLPKTLSAAGYATCLVGKMHLGGNAQFAGFQHRPYGDLTGRCGHQWEPISSPAKGMRERTNAAVGVTTVPESLMQEEVVVSESQAWLREQRHAHPDQPWMLCASFSRPHFPLTAPRRWIDRYPTDKETPPRVAAGGDAWDHPMSVGLRKGFQSEAVGQTELMRARACYRACVSYLDEIIGGMLLRLGADGALDNTTIVYTADHGEMAGEHGVWWKNGWYEGCTRVPLIVSTPAQRSGAQAARRSRTPAALLDLYPTLCGLAGVAAPDGLDGTDLCSTVIGNSEPPARPIICDSLIPRWGQGTEFRSVRLGHLKYVRFRNAPPLCFDVVADPGEQRNLLVRGVPAADQADVDGLARFVADSMDFDAAERARTGGGAALRQQYPQLPGQPGANHYLLPDGRVINADGMLYDPLALDGTAAQCFADYPGVCDA